MGSRVTPLDTWICDFYQLGIQQYLLVDLGYISSPKDSSSKCEGWGQGDLGPLLYSLDLLPLWFAPDWLCILGQIARPRWSSGDQHAYR